tara:strand:- start:38 stop:1189 length:1152 start_codon:yes stop_codon:yes gene_type:complete
MEKNEKIKVRDLSVAEEKSTQELEKELLDKHEAKQQQEVETPVENVKPEAPAEDNDSQNKVEVKEDDPVVSPQVELTEDDIISHIKNRYDKEINSVEELFEQKEKQEELPEDVAAYMEYRKKTGRGFDDYVKLNQDFDKLPDDVLLKQYFMATEDGLDDEDVSFMLEDYKYDEDEDDKSVIKKRQLNKKKDIAKAKKYFNSLKDTYKQPIESIRSSLSDEDSKNLEAYKRYVQQAKTVEEENSRKRDFFMKKTNEVFNSEFKGFEFNIGEEKLIYSPGNAEEVKKQQLNASAFLSKFLDENGLINNAKGYHTALSVAMNPQRFAEFFYEQGKSHATEDVMRKTKNINMTTRKTPEVTGKGGMQVRSLSKDSGRSLKIRSLKNK